MLQHVAMIEGVRDRRARASPDRMGEYFFVKTRGSTNDPSPLRRFQPEDALRAHDTAWEALVRAVRAGTGKTTIVITHHAPSKLGCNPEFVGNGLDGAYYSALDDEISGLESVPYWIHGHTHVAKTYRIGRTMVSSNARGFASKGQGARGFTSKACIDV